MSAHGDGRLPEPDCVDVLDAIYTYLDGELAEVDVESVRAHLDECGPCLRQYDLEQALKALVRRSCQDRAPEHLRTRILAEILQVRTSGGRSEVEVTEVRVTTEG